MATAQQLAQAGKAKRTSKKSATSAGEWKKQTQGMPLEVPSGHTALVRPVGMQSFLQKGMIPNALMPIVKEALTGKEPDLKKFVANINEDQLTDMLELFDVVTCAVVVKPKVLPVPKYTAKHAEAGQCTEEQVGTAIPYEEREEVEALWVDEVDFDDKQFVFNFAVGGTRNVETFRQEQEAMLGSLRPGEELEHETQPDAGD